MTTRVSSKRLLAALRGWPRKASSCAPTRRRRHGRENRVAPRRYRDAVVGAPLSKLRRKWGERVMCEVVRSRVVEDRFEAVLSVDEEGFRGLMAEQRQQSQRQEGETSGFSARTPSRARTAR